MKTLSYSSLLKVSALPTPSSILEGVIVQLSTDNKPYYCDGSTWTDLTATGGGSPTPPGGSNGQIQYNNAGAFAGAANVIVDNNDLCFLENTSPVTPPASTVKMFGKKMAQRMFPAMVGPSGIDAAVQPSIWRQKIGLISGNGNTNGINYIGLNSATTQGTLTVRTVAATNLFTRVRRVGLVSGATAPSYAGFYYTAAQFTVGNGSGLGGFFCSFRFGVSDAAEVAGARMFVGISSTVSAATNIEYDTLTNCIGLAQLSTDSTQLYIVYGGSSAQTAIPLGTNFPPMAGTGAANGIFYDLTLFAPPNSNGVIHYRLERPGTSFFAEGTLTPTTVGTETPASTTLLALRAIRCNNATAAAVGIDIGSVYIETDY